MTKNSNQMLWLSIILSILIHTILLSTIKLKNHSLALEPIPILTVMFSKPVRNEVDEAQNKNAISEEHNLVMTKSPNKEIAPSSKVGINSTVKVPNSIQRQIEAKQVSNEKINFEETNSNKSVSTNTILGILENAKEIAREEGRQLGKKEVPSNDTKSNDKNTLSATIGSAFKRDIASEQKVIQYANGMIEVVTAYGTKYCLIPTKSFERGGPVEVESIPMTCP